MKLEELVNKNNELKEELSVLYNRFAENNFIDIDNERHYNPKEILPNIDILIDEITRNEIIIRKCLFDISDLYIDIEYLNKTLGVLKITGWKKDNSPHESIFNKIELDEKIQEFESKIKDKQKMIDYYIRITDI